MTALGAGCAICLPPDPSTCLAPDWPRPDETHRLVAESHLGAAIRRCRHCGQLFLFLFFEEIDWKNGEDPQVWSYVPVSATEAEQLATAGEELFSGDWMRSNNFRRRLRVEFPGEGPKTASYSQFPILMERHH